MIAEFINYYRNSYKIEFIGDIPCVAHIINLIVNDVMSSLKLNAPKSDEIAIYIDDMEKLAKKKKKTAQTSRQGTPDTLKKIKILPHFINFY